MPGRETKEGFLSRFLCFYAFVSSISLRYCKKGTAPQKTEKN